jgi:two-component system sensor histidine kinase VicK
LLAEPAVQAIVLNYRDITDRKLAEAARTQLAAIVESSDDAIIGKTLDGVIVSWNTGAERLYGYAAAEVIGRPISILAPPDRADEIGEILKRIQRGERVEQFETVRRRKDGRQVPVSLTVSPIKDTIGKTVGASAIARDITERKRLQERLQQERNLLEVTLASIGDAVIATDLTGTLTFINPVAETLTGWTAQEAVGRDIREVFQIINEHSRQPTENPLEKVLREGVVVGLANHTVLIARDGKEMPIADSGAPIQGPSGQVQGMVMVFRDVTESKQAEATLRQAKEAAEAADRAKSDFLATVSHELRTPLYIIVSYTDFLVEGEFGPLQPEQQKPMLAIKRNAAELHELIIGMLDLSQLQREGQLPVDIHAVPLPALFRALQEETQEKSAQSGLEFVWTIEPNLAPIWTDLGKLKTVLKNLLGNAMKFTSKGQITVAASARHGGVEISVSDTGQGIPPDALSLIFEPFRQGDSSLTRSYGGVGLGLYIVKSFLTLLGGKITVESEVGRGSTFRVWLPLSTEPTSA